jgi:hypothetical protein
MLALNEQPSRQSFSFFRVRGMNEAAGAADAARGQAQRTSSAPWKAVLYRLMIRDSVFGDGKLYLIVNSFNQTSLESFFGTFSID